MRSTMKPHTRHVIIAIIIGLILLIVASVAAAAGRPRPNTAYECLLQ